MYRNLDKHRPESKLKALLALFAVCVGLGGMVFLFGWAFLSALDKSAQNHCDYLQRLSKEISPKVFYITLREKDTCDEFGITINGAVWSPRLLMSGE